MLALIDNIGQDIKELKELCQIMSPSHHIQGNQSSNSSGIHRQLAQTPAEAENQRQQTPIPITPQPQFGSQEAPVGSLQGTEIPPPSVLGTEPAERDREFARTGPIQSPIPTVSADFGGPLGDQAEEGEHSGNESLNSSQELDAYKVFNEFHAQLDGPQVQVAFQPENTEQLTDLGKDSDASKMLNEMPNKKAEVLLQQFVSKMNANQQIEKPTLRLISESQKQQNDGHQCSSEDLENSGQIPSKLSIHRATVTQSNLGASLGKQEKNQQTLGRPLEEGTVSGAKIDDDVQESLEVIAPGIVTVCVAELMSTGEIRLDDTSFEYLSISSAQQVFDKMPLTSFNIIDSRTHMFLGNWVFDPGDFIDPEIAKRSCFELQEVSLANDKADYKAFSWEMLDYVIQIPAIFWNKFGGVLNWNYCVGNFNYKRTKRMAHIMPFDRGKSHTLHALVAVDLSDMQLTEFRDCVSIEMGDGTLLVSSDIWPSEMLLYNLETEAMCRYTGHSILQQWLALKEFDHTSDYYISKRAPNPRSRRLDSVGMKQMPASYAEDYGQFSTQFLEDKLMSEGIASSSLLLETNVNDVEFMAILLHCDGGKMKIIVVKEEGLKFPYDKGKAKSSMIVVNVQSVDSGKLNFDVNAKDCECFKERTGWKMMSSGIKLQELLRN